MKLWTPDDVDPEFELTPMIDVVFLLIAFFMTLMSFISAELIKLELPTAEEATIAEEPGERQYISLLENGELYFGSTSLTCDILPQALLKARQELPTLQLYLRADSTTPHRYVNRVMEACAKAGIFNLIFASSQD